MGKPGDFRFFNFNPVLACMAFNLSMPKVEGGILTIHNSHAHIYNHIKINVRG